MNNWELKDIIEKIEENEKLTLKEIAERSILDRSNLSTLINSEEKKEITGRMIGKLKKHFPSYFPADAEGPKKQQIQQAQQANISFEQWLSLHISPLDYISDLREDKKQLQNTIAANLTAMMQILTVLQRHDQAFHETILRSLSRMEGGNIDLVLEARKSEAELQVQDSLRGSNAKVGT